MPGRSLSWRRFAPWCVTALICLLTCCSLSGTVLAAQPPVPLLQHQHRVLIHSPGPQISSLGLSDARVIWTATEIYPLGGANPKLYIPSRLLSYDLRTDRMDVILRTQYGDQGGIYLYQISGDDIAYLDTGVAPFRWQLIDFHLRSGKQEIIAHSTSADAPGLTPSLALSGTNLLWVDQRLGPDGQPASTVYLYDLHHHRTTLLAAAERHVVISRIALDGSLCAWEQDRSGPSGYSSAIVLYDLTTQRRVPLPEANDASQPALHGPYLGWKTGPYATPGQVVLYDLRVHRTVPIPAGPGTFSPTIGDGFLAWSRGANGVVNAFNLRLHRALDLPLPEPRSGFSQPVAAGSLLGYAFTTNVPVQPGEPAPQGYIEVVRVQ